MTRSFLTVRAGATVTHVHCKDMAAMWVAHLIAATVDRRYADVQGPIAAHAPGDTSIDEHLLTTCTPGVNEATCSEHGHSHDTKHRVETTFRDHTDLEQDGKPRIHQS